MLEGIHTDLLVTVTLLFLSQSGTLSRAEDAFSLVTLPDWADSEYLTQCFYDKQNNFICDWTRNQQRTGSVAVTVLESGPLALQSEACLEFWYLTGSELRTLLRSSIDEVEIWSSPALPGGEWRQVFVPLNVMEPGIQVVFEAHEAVSMAGQVRLNQIGVRTGSCGSQCESNTELWTDESTRCLCSDGQLSCSTSQCPQGHTCGPQRLGSSEVLPSGTCTVHSDTDCSTFDGVLFRFMAPCSYVLTKSCSPSAAMPAFSVAVVNKQNGNSSLSTVQQVDVVVGKSRVSLLKGMTHRVVVNGVWKRLPLHLPDVHVKSNPVAVSLRTTFGLLVSYDTAGAIHVTLPSKFSDEVCGLCGNFNHLREDDFTMPDGTNAGDATALAESWQVGQTSSSCEAMLVPYPCNSLEMAEYTSELQCGSLLSSSGPFASCHAVVGSEGYFRGCVASMCSTFGDPMVLCETLEAYAGICQEAGVSLPLWRNSSLCPLQCGENSHYNSCADGCPDVCSSMDIIGSCGSCEERCECDSGYKLNGGKCVPSEDCGCWYKGKHLKKGEEMLEGECETRCLCMGNNDMRCESMRCADNEVCKVQDGVKGCFAFHPATCRVYGDPHYMTFDGMAYDFQGGCSYTLTTTCGRESAVQFSVIGHNMHPPFQNSSRSKLQAVALLVEDLHLTLNMSGDVYVNTSPVTIPYFTNGSFGLVGVDMFNNFIVLESTFGLRIMIDGEHRLFLQVDERYKYELCGLCGTYSGYQDDDFVTPGGQNASGPFEFGDSWRLPDSDGCVSHPDEPRVCDYNEENEAYNECYALLGEPFNPCHEKIHPSIYLNSCVYDYCATSGDQYTLCESLKSYAVACEATGVELSNWQTGTACANSTTTATPPTPPTPPTTPTSSSSTPDQTLCPMNCDFENNLCGWEQLIQDSFDWTRNSGPTPTNLTGPNQDHTTGAGFYMYIEGNSVTHGDSARLMSSMCGYDGPLCLNFWYHMHGSATAMALNIYLLKGNKATKLWSKVNNQGPEWFPGNIDIKESGPFKIIIEGIRGANEHSDIAIDDISIHFGSCPGNLAYQGPSSATTDTLPSHPVCRFDCTFDSNLCAWSQMVTDAFDWTWHSGSTPTMMTGPSSDHTGGGHYLYIEASSVTHGDTSRLISSECSDSGPQCLQFWYHMYGSADTMGLHVYLLQNRYADAVFWKRNDQGNMWHMAQVDLTTTGPFQVIFEGRRGSNEESDIAIDDVRLFRGRCSDLSDVGTSSPVTNGNTTAPLPTTAAPEPTLGNVTIQPNVTDQPLVATATLPPVVETTTDVDSAGNVTEDSNNTPLPQPGCQISCNFEHDLCQWNQLLADVFDWTRHRGTTPTVMTGPSSDHTTGDGHYLYIEANQATHGDTARLISSECSQTGPQCLQFWYHMYGSADTMGLHVYLLQGRFADAVFWKRNDQGNMWHLAQVDLTTTGPFQIIFEGRRGSNDQSDVAIDDVSLHFGHCADLVDPVTPAPTVFETPATEGPGLDKTATPQLPTTTYTTPPHSTTVHPECNTSKHPIPETTRSPEITEWPDHPGTPTNEPQTSNQPLLPTTAGPHEPTTVGPQKPTTVGPQKPTTAGPQEQTTVGPQKPTTAGPQEQTTAGPQEQTTAGPQEQTTVGPQEPTTAGPQEQTTVGPQKPTTAGPQEPTTAGPQEQTTVGPQKPTTAGPQEPTTAGPQEPTTAQSQLSTTAWPQPPSTNQPQPPTTVRPQPPTTAAPLPPTTHRPRPPATTEPQPPATSEPQPPTTVGPKPPTTAEPQPSTAAPFCPEDSHYTTCVPACSPSCSLLNGPPHCSNQGCVPGCVCDDGFVQKGKVCVPIQQCGCVDRNGTKHQFDDVWYTDHCSQKCKCKKDHGVGRIECEEEDECDGDAVCLQNENNDYYCQSTGFGECTIKGDPEYRTFDRFKHEFEGEHSYVLVQTRNLPNNLQEVYIEGINRRSDDEDDSHENDDSSSEEDDSRSARDEDDDDDDYSEEDNEHNHLRELKIRVYGRTVEFKRRRKLIMDGKRTSTPVSIPGLSIWQHSSHIYLRTDFGLSVEFDGQSEAEIILPNLYKRKVGGLCGNFDGRKQNDMMKPDGTRARNVQEFGESWEV